MARALGFRRWWFGAYVGLATLVLAVLLALLTGFVSGLPTDGPDLPGLVFPACVLLGISIGVLAALLAERVFVRPVSSVAEAALRISQGDLAVRAHGSARHGELAGLVRNFNTMAVALERLESGRKETIAAISHELRTPLTILQGRLHALCDGVIPPNAGEHRKLLEQVEHLVRLVEDLNTLTLLDAGKLALHPEFFDLAAFVERLLPVYAGRAAGHGMRITTTLQSAEVIADPHRLQQVLTNLIENSLRYASSGGILEISVVPHGEFTVLELADRGPGLPDAVLGRIFDPFFRGDNSRSRATGGTGLGLTVVQRLIAQHGGHIEALNREGGGALFRIALRARDLPPVRP